MRTLIVVLNWNSGNMTAECIRSLRLMKGDRFDILIIDNGSNDGSVEYLRSIFADIKIVANDRNLGFAAGCNLGMQRAIREGAEYVLLVNNDTIVQEDLLASLILEAEQYPTAGMVSPKIYYYEPPNRLWWAGGVYSQWLGVPQHIGWKNDDNGQFDERCDIDWATGCVLLLRCTALRETGLFDETIFGNGEDLDLSIRMRKRGWHVRYAPSAKLWHKEGFDYRKNVGEQVRKFTGARNILWVMHKHAHIFQWLTFWPYFLVRYVLVIVGTSLLRGDRKSALAILGGIGAFFRMRFKPGSVTLPRELWRTTLSSVSHSASSKVTTVREE